MVYLIDSSPHSISSHTLEYKDGFKTAAKLTIEEDKGQWWVYGVYSNPDYRGQGLARALVEYAEKEYGPIKIQSENDSYWWHMGFAPEKDGFWRRA